MGRERDYLYDQEGPWPQPNPLDGRLFSIALHLPWRERLQWNLRVGLRYAWQILSFTPQALFYALRKPSVEILSDEDFEDRFDNTVFNKMIVPFSKQAKKGKKAAFRTPADSTAPAPDPADGDMPPAGAELPPPVQEVSQQLQQLLEAEHPPMPVWQGPINEAQDMMLERRESLARAMAMEAFPELMEAIEGAIEHGKATPAAHAKTMSTAPTDTDADADSTPPAQSDAGAAASSLSAPPIEPGTRYFIADFSIFEELPTFPDTYAAGTKALFRRRGSDEELDVLCIKVNGVNFKPGDGDAWELAKLFTMQAATIRLVFSTHALLHFPVDAVNAVTKNQLPTDHILYQLLIPHTQLQLVLDQTVQTSATSPLLNKQLFPWCAHTGPSSGLVTNLVQLYRGVKNNPAYPAYHYKYPRRTREEKYVNFLEAYYQTILRFVRKVLVKVEDRDPLVMTWADYVAEHVPGFPDGEHIFARDHEGHRNLDWAVATFIWDVSVGHTTDHYNMGLLDINENPMRVRVKPPTSKRSTFDRKGLRNWVDIFRYRLFWRMFLTSYTVYRLDKVRYPFEDPELVRCNEAFLEDLAQTAAAQSEDEFIPLREIASSVQF